MITAFAGWSYYQLFEAIAEALKDSRGPARVVGDGGRHVLPTAAGLLRFPRYSHDGKFVAYSRGVTDSNRVWIRDVATAGRMGC